MRKKRTDISAALIELHKAQNLAIQTGYKKGEALSYMVEGGIYQQIAAILVTEKKYDSAISNYIQSLLVFEKFRKIEDIVNIKYNSGYIRLKMSQTAAVDKLFNEALVLSKKNGYLYGEKKALHYIRVAALNRSDWRTAEKYILQSLAIDQTINY